MTNCSIVPHPTEPRVLLVAEEQGWTLPRHETGDAEAIRDEMRQRFGLAVTVLGAYTGHFTDAAHEEEVFVFALETHGSDRPLPPDARGIGSADLAATQLPDDEQRQALERWFAEAASGAIPPERAPWERPGWFDEATAWIDRQIADAGWQRTGPVAQLHARGWSSVLRAPTSAGNLYFKAVTQPFGFEPPLTALLARLLPQQNPQILALDQDCHWMLLADAGEPVRARIREEHNPQLFQQLLAAFARFQIALLPHWDALRSVGSPDVTLSRIPGLLSEVLVDRNGLLVGRPFGLSVEEYEQLQALAVGGLTARLADFGIPETLVQEDCHPGHWIAGAQGPVFFDWGDSCLGHPFFSLMMALRWGRLAIGYDAATLDGLRDAYLEQWSAYGSLERLREAYALAWRLAPLTRVLTWRRLVVSQEPSARWQYGEVPAYWLRLFLHGEDIEG
jgi:Phosphotransferase enzyme family